MPEQSECYIQASRNSHSVFIKTLCMNSLKQFVSCALGSLGGAVL